MESTPVFYLIVLVLGAAVLSSVAPFSRRRQRVIIVTEPEGDEGGMGCLLTVLLLALLFIALGQ